MTFQTQTLLRDLEVQIAGLLRFAAALSNLEEERLNYRPHPQSWNVLECLEHLNLYGDFYLPAARQAIAAAPQESEALFKSGWLGGYFVRSMEPEKGTKKIKTFKDKDPFGRPLDRLVITRFEGQQRDWLLLLQAAGSVSLQRTKVPLSIAPGLKLRLGDVLRFVVAHEKRHEAQTVQILGVV